MPKPPLDIFFVRNDELVRTDFVEKEKVHMFHKAGG